MDRSTEAGGERGGASEGTVLAALAVSLGIRGQLGLLVPALFAATLISHALYAAEEERRESSEDLRVRHAQVLTAAAVVAAVHIAENDIGALDTLAAQLWGARDPDLLELEILSPEARVLAHSEPTRFNAEVVDPFSLRAIHSDVATWQIDGPSLSIGIPAVSGLRWGTLVARVSLVRLHAAVAAERAQRVGAAVLLTALVSALLVFRIDQLVVRPVRRILVATRRMAQGDLSARVPTLATRELEELGDAFNHMAAALHEERENLERMVHERTRELQEANKRLETLAVTDGLTGVFNHRRFQEALTQELLRSGRTQRPLSVMMIDVDHFKRFNDAFGHPAGDALLRQLAQTLQKQLRATDFLARYGGEEFAVMLPETTKEEAMQAAERIRVAAESRESIAGSNMARVTVSVGVATLGIDGATPDALISAADRALYVAKRAGRNRVVPASEASAA